MDDLISRRAAIRAYCEHECGKGMIRGECGCDDCGTIFDGIPSAQPELQWIPCNWHKDTENLPDECKSVLICIKDKIGMYVDVSYRTDYNRWEKYGRNVNVVAWCELPEPWRGEEHDEG